LYALSAKIEDGKMKTEVLRGEKTMEIQTNEIVGFIKELVHIPSPSGNTEAAIQYMKVFFEEQDVPYKITKKGAILATIKGEDDSRHRLLTAHVDTLGAMVKEIKSDGRLKLDKIGGYYWNTVEGEYCTIHTSKGKKYSGTVLMHQTAAHVYKGMNDLKRDEKNIEVRVDQELHSKKDAEEAGISVGDFVSFAPRFEETESGFVKSRHLDDKASVAILMYLVKEIKKSSLNLPFTTHFLISNNEEIGYGGNSNIPEETAEYLAVDMGAIGDGQSTDEYTVSICAKDSGGPYHFGLRKHLVELAEKNNVEYKVDIYPYYGSDATAAIRAGVDVVHGLIGPGIDASHAFERTHIKSLEHTANLIKAYLQSQLV
jgi:putative aminopeptidase FrvX